MTAELENLAKELDKVKADYEKQLSELLQSTENDFKEKDQEISELKFKA